MTDTSDKPTLKDIADKEAAKAVPKDAPDKETAQKMAGSDVEAKAKSGGGFVWFVLLVVIAGGAVAAGWPYIGPRVEPLIADIRALTGLTPRPTQARLPSEQASERMRDLAGEQTGEQAELSTPAPSPAPETEASVDASAAEPVDATVEAPVEAVAAADTAAAAVSDMAELQQRLDSLESQVTALGAMSGADGQAALDATAELTQTLTQALSALKNELTGLSDRVQALEDGTRADPTAPAQALVLGVTQLRARLTGDSPFAAELSALEHIAGDDAAVMAALQRLRPHADVGVPSEAALTARFDKVAKAIVTARSTSEAQGWLGKVKDGLGGLVTVRRTDPAQITDEVERAVAVAEAALELGELGDAVEALSGLQGAPGDAAAAWLGDASARLGAEAALEDLHSHALMVLSAAGGA